MSVCSHFSLRMATLSHCIHFPPKERKILFKSWNWKFICFRYWIGSAINPNCISVSLFLFSSVEDNLLKIFRKIDCDAQSVWVHYKMAIKFGMSSKYFQLFNFVEHFFSYCFRCWLLYRISMFFKSNRNDNELVIKRVSIPFKDWYLRIVELNGFFWKKENSIESARISN